MAIKHTYKELIGNTPLFHAHNLQKALGLNFNLLLKLDMFNPAHSSKDRPAYAMLEKAEQEGKINSNTVIVEPTSGNTGIGLAAASVAKGYRVILTMPETMSQERKDLMAAYGAEIVLTEGAKGMKGAIEKAKQIAAELGNAFIPSQFDNHANAEAHYNTTAPEIWNDTNGNVDYFVAGVGTGGTITGVGRYFKERKKDFVGVAVEPETSPVLSGGAPGKHAIAGIGAGFVPSILQREAFDRIVQVNDNKAKELVRLLRDTEGLLVGISSGAAIAGVLALADQENLAGKTVVAFLPDTGERYISTGVFA